MTPERHIGEALDFYVTARPDHTAGLCSWLCSWLHRYLECSGPEFYVDGYAAVGGAWGAGFLDHITSQDLRCTTLEGGCGPTEERLRLAEELLRLYREGDLTYAMANYWYRYRGRAPTQDGPAS